MRKNLFLSLIAMTIAFGVQAQKYFTREGNISFYSEAPLEKIEAHNNQATSVIDTENGRMEFAVLIKAFQFEKALMQEHFNENYMESSTYPKAVFKGEIVNMDQVDLSKDGVHPVKVKGDLTMHGVTNSVEADGELIVKAGSLAARSTFELEVADYKIEIPKVVRDNIAKVVQIVVEIDNYQELKKG